MRRAGWFRLVSLVTLVAFAAGCVTTQLPPISAQGAAFRPEDDEVKLWDLARQEEAKLQAKARLYDDALLRDYLDDVIRRLNPPGMAANERINFRANVIEDPTLNAFAYPHGALYVHTGLLARLENEDQLATVLGHEMTHVEDRHLVRYTRAQQNRAIGFTIAALAAAVVLANEQGRAWDDRAWGRGAAIGVFGGLVIGLGLQLAFLAAVNGYGRDLEREADDGGLSKMRDAGYDTREAAKVYQLLLEDRGRDFGKSEVFFFGSHPRLEERIASARDWNAAHPPVATNAGHTVYPQRMGAGPIVNASEFRLRMRPVVREDARLNLEAGRLPIAEEQLTRVLALTPEDPRAQLYWGRLRSKQAADAKDPAARERFSKDAIAAFREVVRLEPQRAEPYRELGLAAYRAGDRTEACSQFRRYLDQAGADDEAARIRDYVVELKAAGACTP